MAAEWGPAMALTDIKHVFVLMLENRSFDHMLGAVAFNKVDLSGAASAVQGIAAGAFTNRDAAGTLYANSTPAPPTMPVDPPHEYDDVVLQLLNGNADPPYNYNVTAIGNQGFVKSYAQAAGASPLGQILASFTPAQVSNLAFLAQEYCLCDAWYSSLPGPTVPNRFFLLAGTSGGNPKSPPDLRIVAGEFIDKFSFANGNIFQRIRAKTKLGFRIYRGDSLPFSELLDGVDLAADTVPFDPATFAADCSAPDLPEFVLIEPNYGILDGFRSGNSQHPMGNVQAGDQLIRDVYEGISGSAAWGSSVLIITYDEHGGFFDHVAPPKAVAPGDVPDLYDFHFTQLGVRVPAVIVSPLVVRRNLVDHTVYDHTSVLATLREIFPEIGVFTMRDRMAAPLNPLFAGEPPPPAPAPLPAAAGPRIVPQPAPAGLPDDGEPLGHTELSALRIAGGLSHRLGRVPKAQALSEIKGLRTKGEVREYLRRIDAMVAVKARPRRNRRRGKR